MFVPGELPKGHLRPYSLRFGSRKRPPENFFPKIKSWRACARGN